jgi:molybdopterin molybdotransferase
MDMPPFNKSAMDGFACRRADINSPMKLSGIIKAGDMQDYVVEEATCYKIMTGGRMPLNADCVVMVEETTENEDGVVFTGTKTKDNYVTRAYDIKSGDVVLTKGTLIAPQHIAVLASVGAIHIKVYQQTKVAVIATGDEIVEPHIVPNEAQIRNSNASQLLAQIRQMGALPIYLGIAKDDKQETEKFIAKALQIADVLLLTGGVSMGDYDFVPEVLIKLGVDIKFDKVAVKPGKPTVFGITDSCVIFGLPGNPVSSFSIFHLIVRPLIYKTMGHLQKTTEVCTFISEDFSRRSATRTEWFPVVLNSDGTVSPVSYHGSAHIHALCNAQGLMRINPGVNSIHAGDKVYVRFF